MKLRARYNAQPTKRGSSQAPQLDYAEVGAGSTIMQIGGGALGMDQFHWITPILSKHHRVIDVGLVGSQSDADGIPRVQAAALAELIRRSGYGKVHVHGISAGAGVALTLATEYGELVDHLILGACLGRCDAAGRLMRETWKVAAAASGMRSVADLIAVSALSRSLLEQPDAREILAIMRAAFDKKDANDFIAITTAVQAMDLSSLSARLRVPTLLIGADGDHLAPVDPAPGGLGSRGLHQLVKDSRLVVLHRGGHGYFIEQAAEVAHIIESFLEGEPLEVHGAYATIY